MRDLFQYLELRLKSLCGWGETNEAIKYISMFAAYFAFMFASIPVAIVILSITSHHVTLLYAINSESRAVPLYLVLICIPLSFFVGARYLLAQGRSHPTTLFTGTVTDLFLSGGSLFFALSDLLGEEHWFRAPAICEPLTSGDGTEYEVVYNQGTDFIERITRLDTTRLSIHREQRGFVRRTPQSRQERGAFQSAVRAEQNAQRNTANDIRALLDHKPKHWGHGADYHRKGTRTCIVMLVITIALFAWLDLLMLPSMGREPMADPTNMLLLVVLPLVAICGVGVIVLYEIRQIARYKRLERVPDQVTDGTLRQLWADHPERFNWGRKAYALIDPPSQGLEVYLIPWTFAHRVWLPSTAIRITYNPATGAVRDVEITDLAQYVALLNGDEKPGLGG